jgi:hypothetical protein
MKSWPFLCLAFVALLLPGPRLQGQKAESDEAKEAAALRKIDGIQISEEPEGTVDMVSLSNAKLPDATLARLKRFKNLRVVLIHGRPLEEFQDSALAFLEGLKKVEILDCRTTQIGDAGLKHIRNLTRLKELVLMAPEVTDKGMAYLKKLSQLRELYFYCPKVTDAGMIYLKKLTQLKDLSLCCPKVTDTGLAHLQGLKKLKRLGLFSTGVRGTGLVHLKDMIGLQRLDLMGSGVTDEGLKHLPPVKELRWVNVSQTKANTILRPLQKGKVGLRVSGTSARLIAPATRKPVGKTISHTSYRIPGKMRITCWALSPDGKLVVTGAGLKDRAHGDLNNTGQLSVWDATTGKLVGQYEKDDEKIGSVRKVAFFKDSKTILFQAEDFAEDSH